MNIVTSTEIQNNFGKYLQIAQSGEDIIILKNGKEIARLISSDKAITYLSDTLKGVLKKDIDDKQATKERYGKYESIN